jgi:hypothetical protein
MSPESDDLTKEQLLGRLGAERKDQLVSALASHLTKDELVNLLGSRLKKEELAKVLESAGEDSERDEGDENDQTERRQGGRARAQSSDDDASLDWNTELDWAPPPAPTPARVRYTGGAPSLPGQRVRVDLSGLPMMGVFAGRGASAAGTITGVDARQREVKVYLDAGFDGQKEIVVPPERVTPEG